MHCKRRFFSVVFLACFFLAGATTALAAEKITLLLDWFVNPDHAPIIVAQEMGYFADQGLDVEIKTPANPNDPPKLVAAGKVDLAVSYQQQLHVQVDQGLPLVRIATLVATPLNTLLVRADSNIHTIGDLKGKTIGYSVGGFETVLLKVMLHTAGLKLSDVKLVNVNFSLTPSLLSKKVDAVIGAFRNFELNQMALEKHPGRAFYVEEYGIPAYDELIIVANRDAITKAKLRKFVIALERGVQYLVNHPDKSFQLFVKHHKDLDDALNRRAWADTLTRFALRPGAVDQRRYLGFARFLKEQGMIKTIPPMKKLAVELD